MAVLEATGNIFRHASIGKSDATSVLEFPASVPIFLDEALPFSRRLSGTRRVWFPVPFPHKTATHSGVSTQAALAPG
jgi:hypothetical protein